MSEPISLDVALAYVTTDLQILLDRVTHRFLSHGQHETLNTTAFFALNDLFKEWGGNADRLAALLPAAFVSLGATFEASEERNDSSYSPEDPTWQSYLLPALVRMMVDHLHHTQPEVAEEDARRWAYARWDKHDPRQAEEPLGHRRPRLGCFWRSGLVGPWRRGQADNS